MPHLLYPIHLPAMPICSYILFGRRRLILPSSSLCLCLPPYFPFIFLRRCFLLGEVGSLNLGLDISCAHALTCMPCMPGMPAVLGSVPLPLSLSLLFVLVFSICCCFPCLVEKAQNKTPLLLHACLICLPACHNRIYYRITFGLPK